MPRQARKKCDSGIYHVMLRGNDRTTIFHDDEDCERFLWILRKCLNPPDPGKDPGKQGRFLSPGEGRDGSFLPSEGKDGSFLPGKQGRFLSPTACDKETVPLAPLPMDISPEELEAFILSRQVELHPFRERLSDREAEAVLLQVTGLQRAGDFVALSKAEQRRLFSVLYENDLTVPQIARLTGVPKSNIARWV